MPANLSPDYHAAEARFRAARGHSEKLDALQEMLRLIPKHKGTEKLQADIKSRIAKLRRQPRKKGGARVASHAILPEGAGQVALVGPPNTGKSTLVATLTHASPEVADYPYTTREATPGMMAFEDVGIQLIDLPPLGEEYMEPWVFDIIRRADLLWIVVDESNSLDGLEAVRVFLRDRRISPYPSSGARPEGEVRAGCVAVPAMLVVTGRDHPGCPEDLKILEELLADPWPIAAVSAPAGVGLDELRRCTFEALGVVRVYSKLPGRSPDRERPFTLARGSTVGDLAERIHKDLGRQFRFARIWGSSAFDGQTVQRDHVLVDGDVVEIHN